MYYEVQYGIEGTYRPWYDMSSMLVKEPSIQMESAS
jgi:hypothetical protein